MKRNKDFIQQATLLMALSINSYSTWLDFYNSSKSNIGYKEYMKIVSINLAKGDLVEIANINYLEQYIHNNYGQCFMNGFLINMDELPHIICVGKRYYDDIKLRFKG